MRQVQQQRVDQQMIRLRIEPHHRRRHRHPARLIDVDPINRLRVHFFDRIQSPAAEPHRPAARGPPPAAVSNPAARGSASPPEESPPPPPPARTARPTHLVHAGNRRRARRPRQLFVFVPASQRPQHPHLPRRCAHLIVGEPFPPSPRDQLTLRVLSCEFDRRPCAAHRPSLSPSRQRMLVEIASPKSPHPVLLATASPGASIYWSMLCPSCAPAHTAAKPTASPRATSPTPAAAATARIPLPPIAEPIAVGPAEFDEIIREARVPFLSISGPPGADPAAWPRLTSLKPPATSPAAPSFSKSTRRQHPQLAARYQVQGIPNFAVFSGGNLAFQQAGLVDANTMKSWLTRAATQPA